MLVLHFTRWFVFAIGLWVFRQFEAPDHGGFLPGWAEALWDSSLSCAPRGRRCSVPSPYIGLPGAYYRTGVSFFGIAGNIVLNAACMYFIGSRMWAVARSSVSSTPRISLPSATAPTPSCIIAMIISVASLLPYLGLQIRGAGLTLQGVTKDMISFETGLTYITLVVLLLRGSRRLPVRHLQ